MTLRQRALAVDASTETAELEEKGLGLLREQVQKAVSVDDLASMMKENLGRARNEVKSICRQEFENQIWEEVPQERRESLVVQLIDEMFGFGPLEELLSDESITEVMVNGPHKIFYEQNGKLYKSSHQFSDVRQLRALIDRILGPLGRRVDESSPLVNARLPLGHRVHVVLPPLALSGPILTVRKFASQTITLEEMSESGSFDKRVLIFLTWAVLLRKNIAVSGGTGSGKTTLLNALSCVIPGDERIITIEDSAELRFLKHPHVVSLEARPQSAEGSGEVSIQELVINALRMRPDRIVVGECRGAEAIDMLQAMNTGHDGSLTTLHANSPRDVVSRLTTMVRYGADLPVDVVEANVSSALDVVVQTARSLEGKRYVSEIAEIIFDEKRRVAQTKTLYRRRINKTKGVWEVLPYWLDELAEKGVAREEEVEEWVSHIFLEA